MLVAAGVALFGLPACGDDGPSADEERVCSAVQTIVDKLAGGYSLQAVTTLDELEQAATATSNETMAKAGADFFEVLSIDVDRFQLTIPQVRELGERIQRDSARALDAILAECRNVGTPIERLPQA